ncbi:Y-family DNA polymerase [Sneathiella sp. HT1-7]|uniref:Y-family DNA polymerase n=1 Tax=Sneathiella sp. HT1-7 TaxID=2887192 RepID=UPI001D155505|nr:DNA polymerase Y family protein [Sneathiella sp. HT1-7]MCC3305210.1 DNA polymerase Y family protein [Sneathiella sp. HT1-7]
MQRMICIWFPFLESERLIRQNHDLATRPFALVMREANRAFVSALSRNAGNMGFAPGMSLADVRAAAPDMLYFDADPMRDIRCLQGLLRWASRFTPRVSRGGGHNLYLDIAGASHLFGGEDVLLEKIETQLEDFGFTTRLALADSKAAAWGFTHFGSTKSNITTERLEGAARELPVEALRLSYASTALCQRLGLKKIGELTKLSRVALTSRLGLDGVCRIDRFFGRTAEVTEFARHKKRLIEEEQFFDPLATNAGVEAALERMLEKLCQRLSGMRQGVRKSQLQLDRVDHETMFFSIQLTRPSIDVNLLKRLFLHHFDQIDVGFGIDRLILVAEQVAPLSCHQLSLENSQTQNREQDLEKLINELSNMVGARYVQRFFPVDSHIPERTFSRVAALYASRLEEWQSPSGTRPLRILKKPVSVLLRDGIEKMAPETVFWHGRKCHLTPLSGPERIEPDWWRDDPDWRSGGRDYWWAKADFGALLWLYRVSDEEKTQWFVHGLGS